MGRTGVLNSLVQLPSKALRLAWRQLAFEAAPLAGGKRAYAIHPGYVHRNRAEYFDDTENSDEWQREVYEVARDLMRERGWRTVNDVGCGSGFKLVHILGEFETTGIDLPETIARVRRRYPDRCWLEGSFDALDVPAADLVICSDVIEHVEDPDALMQFLARCTRDYAIISTPDRDLVYGWRNGHRFGPPENPCHLREWNMREFADYVRRFFKIERHFISNKQDATQCIVARVPR